MANATVWTAIIPLVVPLVIGLLKTWLPNLPKVVLPILAPILGALADIGLHFAGAPTVGPIWGAALGTAGVGLREIADQLRKTITQP